MEDKNNLFADMKAALQEQLKEAYLEGVNTGSVSTCAIIYATLTFAGLEEPNFLYTCLDDIAKRHGCDNLKEKAEELRPKN